MRDMAHLAGAVIFVVGLPVKVRDYLYAKISGMATTRRASFLGILKKLRKAIVIRGILTGKDSFISNIHLPNISFREQCPDPEITPAARRLRVRPSRTALD